MALCHVTGLVYLPNGELARNRAIVFEKTTQEILADYLSVVMPDDVIAKTDATGNISVHLISGTYSVAAKGPGNYYFGTVGIPDEESAGFADVLSIANPAPLLPSWLVAAAQARDEAVQAAQDAADSAATVAGMQDDIDNAVLVSGQADVKAMRAMSQIAPLLSYAMAIVATQQPWLTRVSAIVGGRFVEWVRDASGTCLGGGWSPAGQATPQHWGAVGDGVADDSDALEGAYMSGREIFIPAGVYRQTREVSAVHPLNVVGAGTGSAILLYENMGGYEGSNGISLQASVPSGIGTNALGSASSVRGVTVKITGQNGASWFKAPRAQANLWTRVKPTYRFDSIYFTGDNAGDAAYFELNTTAWECCIDLGEGCNHSITKITGAGNYDFRAEPTAEAVRSTFLRLGGAEAGPGGILTPELSHWWLQHFGRAIDIGWRVIRGQFHGLAIHACWQGMYSPNPRSGSNWGIDELEMSACNINVQKNAIYMRGPTGGMTFDNVDMTRATGGYDHGTGWVGMDIDNANRLSIKGGRAYNDGTTGEYSGGTTGYLLANVSNLMAGGQLIRGIGDDQMTAGMRIVNPGRGEISGLAVVGKIIDLIEFAGTPLSTGSNVGFTLTGIPKTTAVITGNRVKYSDGVTRALVNDLDEPQPVNSSATSISAAGSEDYTPGASPKWRRISFAAGAGAYTYDINMLAAGAREGDEVEFTFTFLAANGTVRILDSTGAVQFTKAGTTGQAWYVRGRYLGTSPALFRVMASSLNA